LARNRQRKETVPGRKEMTKIIMSDWINKVRYHVDVPLWTRSQRKIFNCFHELLTYLFAHALTSIPRPAAAIGGGPNWAKRQLCPALQARHGRDSGPSTA